MQGGDVIYYPCEITQELAFARGMTNITQRGMGYLYENPEKFKDETAQAIIRSVAGNLVIKGYPAGTATITTLRNHARMVIQQYNLKNLKAIIIDYADTVMPSGTYEKEYLRQAGIYTEARALGAEFKVPVIMPDRMTKEATDKRVPDQKAFQGAFEALKMSKTRVSPFARGFWLLLTCGRLVLLWRSWNGFPLGWCTLACTTPSLWVGASAD